MMLVLRVRRSGGFSLIELLAASVIVGILASVAVPFMETALKRQKEQALRVALRDIRNAIDAYKQATLDGRIKIEDGKTGYPASLLELTDGIEDAKDPKKPRLVFLRRIPRDPFYGDSRIAAASTWGLRSYASSSEQPQVGDDVFDVYSMSDRTGLNGVPYKEW
ncbi:type II secretion system protein [Pseudoduganella sp. R-43]|uniref:type II secretion system protein n=1 Tax=Pseudoduganella sp. R-43 TaxID=3404063 RepID=UPI003CE922A7